jgi:pyridinium-3,5-biscarboxylic acid mononucleotide synthase
MRRAIGGNRFLLKKCYFSNLKNEQDNIITGRVKEIGNFAKIDLDRAGRAGFPEVIFAKGKSSEHLSAIMKEINKTAPNELLIATKVDNEQYQHLKETLGEKLHYCTKSKIAYCGNLQSINPLSGKVAILCAGTSDYNVAEEAARLLELSGANNLVRLYDVGVAGLNRLLSNISVIKDADVVIVCAGMDGALPSVVGGLTAAPVIAVPTSIGYGAAFGGVSALLTMVNSCSPGVTVVNIDNGFGAAVTAYKILKKLDNRHTVA